MSDYGVKDIKTLEGAYDKDNNLIQEFDSLQLAAQFCGGNSSTISAVCRGKRNSHKNYIWRYLD